MATNFSLLFFLSFLSFSHAFVCSFWSSNIHSKWLMGSIRNAKENLKNKNSHTQNIQQNYVSLCLKWACGCFSTYAMNSTSEIKMSRASDFWLYQPSDLIARSKKNEIKQTVSSHSVQMVLLVCRNFWIQMLWSDAWNGVRFVRKDLSIRVKKM